MPQDKLIEVYKAKMWLKMVRNSDLLQHLKLNIWTLVNMYKWKRHLYIYTTVQKLWQFFSAFNKDALNWSLIFFLITMY